MRKKKLKELNNISPVKSQIMIVFFNLPMNYSNEFLSRLFTYYIIIMHIAVMGKILNHLI